jgi:hypothetical protein
MIRVPAAVAESIRSAVWANDPVGLLKKAHLSRAARDCPHPSSLRRTSEYASLLRISGALHLDIFEQPGKLNFTKIC